MKPSHTLGRKSAIRRAALAAIAILLLATAAFVVLKVSPMRSASGVTEIPGSFGGLLKMSAPELAGCDIALLNLLCTEGLPGAEALSPEPLLAQLDSWAAPPESLDVR